MRAACAYKIADRGVATLNSPARKSLLIHTVGSIDTHTAATATSVLWCAALGLYAVRLFPHLVPSPSTSVFDVGETFLLAVACLGFQLSAFRVGLDHLARIWRASLDPVARTARNPVRWRVFGWIGAGSCLGALAIGVPAATSVWHPDSTDLIFALVIALIPAVQCTGAAVVGPILTHAIEERETARAAHNAILEVHRAAVSEHQSGGA